MRTRRALMATSVFLSFAFWSVEPAHAQQNNVDSLERTYLQALAHLSTPKLEERKHLLRSFQRRGYANTLAEVLHIDGFSALASYLRTRLQIEYSISHEPIMVDISARHEQPTQPDPVSHLLRPKPTIVLPTIPREPMMIGLDIDWTFPEDPWERE